MVAHMPSAKTDIPGIMEEVPGSNQGDIKLMTTKWSCFHLGQFLGIGEVDWLLILPTEVLTCLTLSNTGDWGSLNTTAGTD